MKKLFILTVCLFVAVLSVSAQDLIVKKDRSVIKANIISVTETTVEYKKANYTDGPTFSVSLNSVASITYANGEKQEFKDQKADELAKKGIERGMKYKDYKHLYNARDYSFSMKGPYAPIGAGIGSAFITGLGQMFNSQWGKGIGMMLGEFSLNVAGFVILAKSKTPIENGKFTTSTGGTIGAITCFTGAFGIWIWSICDAVKVAKIQNLYYWDCQRLHSQELEVKVMPNFAFAPTGNKLQPTAGMTLSISF